jgi:hypothetical protein
LLPLLLLQIIWTAPSDRNQVRFPRYGAHSSSQRSKRHQEKGTIFYSSSDQEMIKETMTIAMSTDQVHTRVHTQSPLQLSLVMNCIAVVGLFFFFFFFSVIASLPSIPKEDSVALKAI